MKVVDFLLDSLVALGVNTIFGNPGTTEIPLVAACEQRDDVEYVVGLSEISVVPMADGYARAQCALSVVNLHVSPGLGNGMGALYTAGRVGTPMLVLVGGQDSRFLHTDPVLWGPVEKMAGSVCKSVLTIRNTQDAAAIIRQALRLALSLPYAPVALICPPDLLEVHIESLPAVVVPPQLACLSDSDALAYATFLEAAKSPALIVSEAVFWNGACAELEQLADLLQAPIYIAPYTGILPISSASHCYAGYLPPNFGQIAERLKAHDSLLFVGATALRTTLYSDVRLTQASAWIGNSSDFYLNGDEYHIARVVDLRTAIPEITAKLSTTVRLKQLAHYRPEVALPQVGESNLHPTRLAYYLLSHFQHAIWVDESGLSTSDIRQWMSLDAGDYIINGSGGIGWGLPAAVGVAIAKPERSVVAIIGDGSALYASEAMWTAENRGVAILLVVLSNGRYATLNAAANKLIGKPLSSFTVDSPRLDFSGLARLYGWEHVRIDHEEGLMAFIDKTGRVVTRNTVLEVILDPEVTPVTASRHF